jgi:hypothetical protein
MARRYYSSTAVGTTYTSDLTAGQTTIPIAAAVGLPTQYPYRMALDYDFTTEELVDVTNRVGLTLTVVRGVDGTTAQAHTSGGDIRHVISAGDMAEANAFINALPQVLTIALSDEVTALTTGTAKVTMRMPYACTLTSPPRASLSTASTSGSPTVDINKNGTSILHATNKLAIDANEKTSVTSAFPTSLVTTAIADNDEITFDIDSAGTGAKGLKVTLYYTVP